MSFIMVAGRQDGIYIAADQRCVWEGASGEIVIQENYPKIVKLPDHSFLAFSGRVECCVPIVMALYEQISEKQINGVEEYVKFCADKAAESFALDPTTNIQMLLAGKQSNQTLCIGDIHYFKNNNSYEIIPCTDMVLHYRVKSCLDPKETFVHQIMSRTNHSIISNVQECIKVAALKSNLINDRISDGFVPP